MSTLDLINAMESGNAMDIERNFNEVFAEKISKAVDDFRVNIASNLFTKQETNAEQE